MDKYSGWWFVLGLFVGVAFSTCEGVNADMRDLSAETAKRVVVPHRYPMGSVIVEADFSGVVNYPYGDGSDE